MTLAPQSASCRTQVGPARTRVRSSTVKRDRACEACGKGIEGDSGRDDPCRYRIPLDCRQSSPTDRSYLDVPGLPALFEVSWLIVSTLALAAGRYWSRKS